MSPTARSHADATFAPLVADPAHGPLPALMLALTGIAADYRQRNRLAVVDITAALASRSPAQWHRARP
jgi:hypothetical protein